MRLRNSVAAAVGSLALVLSIPGSASAVGSAHGTFQYRFGSPVAPHFGELIDPDTRVCINLPEGTDVNYPPAFHPENQTDSTATAWTGPNCTGDYNSINPYKSRNATFTLRSVVFS
ncbi:hypothetical protein P3T36_003713 [Kitasatospora sp. MAP12-15]|uniref:hypothetical protein n=1 Tax=unclassified Kitasatospora TaxID=2633591 RepID=UPI0024740D83|nr:hypothetical protein [Kitasatospora sp. MAP12-44]MDH6112301.1 hypothetical protein [Kitasatospora sp. MAP12-44]